MTGRDAKTGQAGAGNPGRDLRRHPLAPLRGLSVLLLCAVMGCTPIYSMHGYAPDDETLAQIETGVDTRETVAAFLGRPTTDGLLNDEAWFYVQSRWKSVGMGAPQEYDRQVVAVTFSEDGRVANIERFGLERGEIVPLSRRVTSTPIKGRSALSQIFSNFGRVDAASLFRNR
ncbi:outer membrane protein assembly factor BamE [Stagnihabitans tardus]|nr:outer membrane protein assembly factor BamE [Stagnihabitans tardus]